MKGVIYLNQDKKPTNEAKDKGKETGDIEGEEKIELNKTPTVRERPKREDKIRQNSNEKEEINHEVEAEILPETEPLSFREAYKKEEEPLPEIFTPTMQKYIKNYKNALKEKKKTPETAIHVDEIATKIARVYERLRRVIDWKEEHLVRRTAIERILKRRLISEISEITMLPDLKPQQMAGPLTLEIIRTGYFENGKISEDKIGDVAKILEKYIYILKNSPYAKETALAIKTKVQFYNWILEVAACEIEELLDYPYKEDALIEFMTDDIYENLKLIPENKISEEDKYIQTYIAVHKTLFNLDDPVIFFHVLKKRYPLFLDGNKDFLREFTQNVESFWKGLNKDLEHPTRGEFQTLCEKYDAAYLILSDVMKELEKEEDQKLTEKITDKEHLKNIIEKVYNERLQTLKARLFRSAFYSTLSIFVAGGASLVIFEFPIAKLFYGEFAPWAMVADIMIPTALMFFLVAIIRPPSEDNLERVKEEVLKLVYADEERHKFKIKLDKKIKKVQNFIFTIIYLLGGFGSLYLIYKAFKIAGVPLTSLYIDTVNVAVVVFAAMAIRQKSKEITIKERTSILEFLLDFFSVPLAKFGSWLSAKWKEFNFVSVFFSTLVDSPFSTFIEFLEGWRNYIKEKRSRI